MIRMHYILYGIAFFFTGAQYAVPGALFKEICGQLNITTGQMSVIYSAGEISIGVSALFTGYVVDYACKRTSHVFLSFLGLLSAGGYFAMIYIQSYYLMLLDWILVSATLGAIECAAVVYLYRISSKEHVGRIVTANFLLMGIGSTLTAQLIAISIQYIPPYNYGNALTFMAIISALFSVLAIILKTPATMDKNVSKESQKLNDKLVDTTVSINSVATAVEQPNFIFPKQKQKQILFFRVMICLIIGLYAGQKACYLSLGITYATQHINVSNHIGQALITSFWTGKMISQILLIYIVKKFQPEIIILFGEICMTLNAILFILIELSDDEWKISVFTNYTVISALLITIYGIAAFVSIPVYVISFSFIKQIENMSGFISGLILVSYTFGCGLFAFIGGMLYQHIGGWTYPFMIFVTIIIALTMWGFTHKQFKLYKSKSDYSEDTYEKSDDSEQDVIGNEDLVILDGLEIRNVEQLSQHLETNLQDESSDESDDDDDDDYIDSDF